MKSICIIRSKNMKIGVIGAMDAEINTVVSALQNIRTSHKANLTITEGSFGSIEAVVVRCGVGKVNAALCAQILIDCYGVTHIINSGIAGSLNNEINIGDVVVSTDAVMHDMDATVFGYEPGQTPGMRAGFKADEELMKLCLNAIRETAPDINVFEGRVASGDQFISKREIKNRIRDTFRAECCEMEGAAIAQTASANEIPFVIVRYISDKADESTIVPYVEFEAKAADNSAKLIVNVLNHLGKK